MMTMAHRYPTCEEAIRALEAGADCHDFRGIRESVMCRAWQEVREGRTRDFGQAVRDGWDLARRSCAAHGGITPESGFLESSPPPLSQVYEVRQAGAPVGVVTLDADGHLFSCVRTCSETDVSASPDRGQSALQAALDAYRAQGYEVVSAT